VTVFGRGRALQYLQDLVHDRIATSAEPADDLELAGGLCVMLCVRTERRNETDGLAVELDALTNDITGLQDVL
jgi:hypothetical protein